MKDRREDCGMKTAQQWRPNGKCDHLVNERQFIYARTSFEQEKIKDIQLPTTVGAGYGWQIFEDEDTKLSLRTGLDYVNVDRIVSQDDDYPAPD